MASPLRMGWPWRPVVPLGPMSRWMSSVLSMRVYIYIYDFSYIYIYIYTPHLIIITPGAISPQTDSGHPLTEDGMPIQKSHARLPSQTGYGQPPPQLWYSRFAVRPELPHSAQPFLRHAPIPLPDSLTSLPVTPIFHPTSEDHLSNLLAVSSCRHAAIRCSKAQ